MRCEVCNCEMGGWESICEECELNKHKVEARARGIK